MSDTLIPNERPKIIDEIWATLDRTAKGLEEVKLIMKASAEESRLRQAEAAEESKRRQDEYEKRMAEWQARHEKWKEDFERVEKRTAKALEKVIDPVDYALDTLVDERLWEKFSAYPYDLRRAHKSVMVYKSDSSWQLTEIDLLLSCREWVMAIAVKHDEVEKSDVEHHVKRLKLIRDNPPAEAKGKKLLGAVAGEPVSQEARDFAFESGFFVVELKNENEDVELIPPPAGFTPTELTCGQS